MSVKITYHKEVTIAAGYTVSNGVYTATFKDYEEAVHFANMRFGAHFSMEPPEALPNGISPVKVQDPMSNESLNNGGPKQ